MHGWDCRIPAAASEPAYWTRKEPIMSKQILVISTSLRANSNSDALAEAFAQGAQAAGHHVTRVSLHDKSIAFCRGCFGCLKTGECVIKDDAIAIVRQMHDADTIAFATPIYYYEMSGQMKTLLDRANSLYDSDYRFQDIYFLSAAAENEEGVDHRAVSGLTGWIDCFGRARLAGTVFAGGVNDAGEIKDHPALKTAWELGQRA